jgi:hypothetical protein
VVIPIILPFVLISEGSQTPTNTWAERYCSYLNTKNGLSFPMDFKQLEYQNIWEKRLYNRFGEFKNCKRKLFIYNF